MNGRRVRRLQSLLQNRRRIPREHAVIIIGHVNSEYTHYETKSPQRALDDALDKYLDGNITRERLEGIYRDLFGEPEFATVSELVDAEIEMHKVYRANQGDSRDSR